MSAPAVYHGLINSPSTQVVDSIAGFLLANPHCRQIDNGGRDIKVVVRGDWSAVSPSVGLVSGGGDGHAPAHTGFIGSNLLTGGVCGEVFASPSVAAILTGIRAVARPAGTSEATPRPVLLIVKNYTGDRLNFGLALSQAALEGIHAEMVIVGDDVTLPRSKGVTGRRGIAGTVLVHKIAGAAASQGSDLKEVHRRAEQAARSIVSIGVATAACQVPGAVIDAQPRLAQGRMEIGMGIHNEAGGEQLPLESASSVVSRLVSQLLSRDPERDYFYRHTATDAPRPEQAEIVLLVNNLGAATATEVNIFAAESVRLLSARGLVVRRLIVGTFMTALNMPGISLSVMRLDENKADAEWQLAALDLDTNATGWPKTIVRDPAHAAPLPTPNEPVQAVDDAASTEADAPTTALLATLAQTILTNAAHLNALDALSGDGDCGSTLSLGAHALEKLVQAGITRQDLPQLLQRIARGLALNMGGSSGAILQILLTAAAAHTVDAAAAPRALQLAQALEVGIAAVSKFGGAVEGDRTMLDALAPAVRTFRAQLEGAATVTAAIDAAAAAARQGADGTRNMVSRAGRANYVSGEALSQVDPGAEAVALLWKATAEWGAGQQ